MLDYILGCRFIDNYESDAVPIEEVVLNRKWYEKV